MGYRLDGGKESPIPRTDIGTFQVSLMMNAPHVINVDAVPQYLLSLSFTDNSQSRSILPTKLQLDIQGFGIRSIQDMKVWLDNGTSFSVVSVIWEGVDVKPQDLTRLTLNGPTSMVFRTRVYDATIRVTDGFGIPVSGASASIALANGTTISRITGSNGTITTSMIPLGTYQATITNLGASTQLAADASVQREVTAQVPLSYPVISTFAAIIVVPIVAIAFLLKTRGGRKRFPKPVPRQKW